MTVTVLLLLPFFFIESSGIRERQNAVSQAQIVQQDLLPSGCTQFQINKVACPLGQPAPIAPSGCSYQAKGVTGPIDNPMSVYFLSCSQETSPVLQPTYNCLSGNPCTSPKLTGIIQTTNLTAPIADTVTPIEPPATQNTQPTNQQNHPNLLQQLLNIFQQLWQMLSRNNVNNTNNTSNQQQTVSPSPAAVSHIFTLVPQNTQNCPTQRVTLGQIISNETVTVTPCTTVNFTSASGSEYPVLQSSDNPSVAVVTSTTAVLAHAPGTAHITVAICFDMSQKCAAPLHTVTVVVQ